MSASVLSEIHVDLSQPTLLCNQDGHKVYWLGINHQTAFRCNAYLIHSGDHYVLVDPGSPCHMAQMQQRVAQIVDPACISAVTRRMV